MADPCGEPASSTSKPLLDDQENDTRLSTGAIYWEGAVRAYEQRRLVGRGYLEMTGYGERLRPALSRVPPGQSKILRASLSNTGGVMSRTSDRSVARVAP